MVFGLVAAAFLVSTGDDPLDSALVRTEPPPSLRAAFTVELTDGEAFREIRFDPRDPEDEAWQVVEATGQSRELDFAVEEWGAEDDPDGWLFADDLRASLGNIVDAIDAGAAWQIQFQHQLSGNDGPLDAWAAEHLAGSAWLEPVNAQFLRIDYSAMEPFSGPNGGRIEAYNHTYLLQQDPEYDITFVAAYKVDVRGQFLNTSLDRAYRVRVTDVDFFFSSAAEEALYWSRRRALEKQHSAVFVSAN